jgi:hypothetical protein
MPTKKRCRIETKTWQQHTVTAKSNSLKITDKYVSFVTASGEKLRFDISRLVWITQSESATRVSYNRLVVSSGTSNLVLKSVTDSIATLYQPLTKTTMYVNTKFHKLYKES